MVKGHHLCSFSPGELSRAASGTPSCSPHVRLGYSFAKIAGVIAQRIGVAVPGDVQSRLEATSGSPVAAASRFNSRSWTK